MNTQRTRLQERNAIIFAPGTATEWWLPLVSSTVSAGFPSPADDSIDEVLDLNKFLIRNPSATFFVKVKGDSMRNANIADGDLLVVDRSIKARDNDIVLAIVDGEFTVKRLRLQNGTCSLLPENDSYKPIHISQDSDFEIWGVVVSSIHQFLCLR
jgi:DNA polymerase V